MTPKRSVLRSLLRSRAWLWATVACSLFALYMASREEAAGNSIAAALYLIVSVVLIVSVRQLRRR